MALSKKTREQVRLKFDGLCAYTGKPLDEKWQVDHVEPQYRFTMGISQGDRHCIDNLLPACRIINHYKRGQDLELFRSFMLRFHERLRKLPKKTTVKRTEDRIAYLNQVAFLFDITPEKPFSGKFYFETIITSLEA